MSAEAGPCRWTFEADDEAWRTDCGTLFEIMEGTPADNGMKYCHYCGRQIEEVIPADEKDAE